jgi:hypothetical protein
MKRAAIFSIAGVALLAAAYFGSPFLGYYRIKSAAQSGNQDALEATIDFPAVRESLRSQLHTGIAAKLQSDPKMKSNSFARFGMMLAATLVDKMVDSYLTPEAISLMLSKAKAPSPSTPDWMTRDTNKSKIDTHFSYISLDRVRVSIVDPKQPDIPLSFVMERRGFISWKLIRIELPAKLFQ